MTTKALVKRGFDRFVITALSFTTTSSHIRGRHRKVKKAYKLKLAYVTMIRTNIEMPPKKSCILGLVLKVAGFRDFVLKTIFCYDDAGNIAQGQGRLPAEEPSPSPST